MNKAFIRPLILILVFFLGLFVMREPLRNMDSNFALLKYHYINPLISYVKGETKNSDDAYKEVYDGYGNIIEPLTEDDIATTSSKDPIKDQQFQPRPREAIISNELITADDTSLTIEGVLSFTNQERLAKKAVSLKLNSRLNRSAELKLLDMFANQYFQHVSPTGVGVSDLVRKTGYEYIVVGENLALGNFGGDKQVVRAWMNSPGHRANILDPRYQEMGIAVGKGMYNGKEQWIAVQHFGKPLSSCEGPNDVLKDKIAIHTNELSAMEAELASLKREIEQTTDRGQGLQDMIEDYNMAVVNYNNKLEGLKDEINTYNIQVRNFNTCAGLVSQ